MSYSAKMVSFTKIDFSSNVLKSTQNSIISTIFYFYNGTWYSMWNWIVLKKQHFWASSYYILMIDYKVRERDCAQHSQEYVFRMKWGHVWFHPSVFVMQQSHTSSMQHLIWVNSIKAGQLLRGCDTWNPYWAWCCLSRYIISLFSLLWSLLLFLIQCFIIIHILWMTISLPFM